MKILAFNGSPRRKGNTSLLLREVLRGAADSGAKVEEIIAKDVALKYCRGCLRCNVLKRCAIRGDDWPELSLKILDADTLIFASPIYFHHLTAALKMILDRFRSFIKVQITEQGLNHLPWHEWRKEFIVLLCLGSSDQADTFAVMDLFKYIVDIMGPQNTLRTIVGTRLAVNGQVAMTAEELRTVYPVLGLPVHPAEEDFRINQKLLKRCYDLGKDSAKRSISPKTSEEACCGCRNTRI